MSWEKQGIKKKSNVIDDDLPEEPVLLVCNWWRDKSAVSLNRHLFEWLSLSTEEYVQNLMKREVSNTQPTNQPTNRLTGQPTNQPQPWYNIWDSPTLV